MENSVESFSEDESQHQEDEQDQQKMPWEEIFDGVPTAPGTEAAQERHKQLREQDDMTEKEEEELGELFYIIYPQFRLEAYEKLKYPSLQDKEMRDRQGEITLTLLLLEVFWCWITLLHCGMTIHGLVGCMLVVWWCLLVNHLANSKDPERFF